MKPAARFVPTVLLAATLAVSMHARAEEPAPAEQPAAPKYHALTLKDGRELKGTYDGGTLTLYNDAGKPMGSVAVKEDEIAKKEELPWPFAAATEKPADAAAGKRVLHVLTMKDGRELKGVYDKAAGSIQMFASNGKPMGTLAVKEEEIAKVEETDWPYSDPGAPPAKADPPKAPPAAGGEAGVDAEALKDVQAKARAFLQARADRKRAGAEEIALHKQYRGATLSPEESRRVRKLVDDCAAKLKAARAKESEAYKEFTAAYNGYARKGGKKAQTDFVPKE